MKGAKVMSKTALGLPPFPLLAPTATKAMKGAKVMSETGPAEAQLTRGPPLARAKRRAPPLAHAEHRQPTLVRSEIPPEALEI